MSALTRLPVLEVIKRFLPGFGNSRPKRTPRFTPPSAFTPRLEPLEDRRMLSVTLFVDADAPAGGDGLGWATAYDSLQSALESAAAFNADQVAENDVDAIWIAEGVYRPSAELEPGDARSASFSLVDGVALYGGFAGTETVLTERSWTAHGTVLSGDLGVAGDGTDNAYTVVYCGEDVTAGLDGVTVTGGNADGEYDADYLERSCGGGIYNSGTLTLANCIFTENSADHGGGIYSNYFSTLTVTDCTLRGNSADADGGAICNRGALTVTNSILVGNAAAGGGGIYAYGGTLTVTNSTLCGNAAERGGGIHDSDSNTLTLNNSILWRNSGGELESDNTITASRSLIAIDPKFVRDPSEGGDGWGDNPDTPEVDESANDDFGDLRLTAESVAIDYGDTNLAVDAGGNPLTADLDGNPRIHGTAVDAGAYELQGTASAGRENASLTVTTSEDVFDLYDGQISLREAIFHAGVDPLGTTITFDGSLDEATIALCGSSLWIDKALAVDASNLTSLTIDADAKSRAFTVMPGDGDAVELMNLTVTGGSAGGTGGGIHGTGTLAVTSCVFAGNSAGNRGGAVYSTGTLTVTDCTLSDNSAERYGGGICSTGTLTVANSTISDNSAQWGGGGIYSTGVVSVLGCEVRGNSTISNGGGIFGGYNSGALTVTNSTFADNSANCGGGIYNGSDTAASTLNNSTFFDNTADAGGGGVYNIGTLAIADCTLSSNSAHGGGGVYNTETLVVTGSTLSGNSASVNRGGGIYSYSGTLTVTNSTLSGNSAKSDGGGIYGDFGTLMLTNTLVLGNSAGDDGGGVFNHSALTVTNCTFADNSAEYGGGIYNKRDLTLNNSIVAKNTAPSGPDIGPDNYTLTGSHNLIGDGSGQSALVDGADGNLVGSAEEPLDPLLLVDGRLQIGSPAVDAGDNSLVPPETTTDLAGAERIQDGDGEGTATVDMGAYEGVVSGPYLSISDSSAAEGDSGTQDMVFTVTLSEAADHAVAFDYTTRAGTAQAETDYTAISGNGTIPAGTTTATIAIPILGDTSPEPDETFSVILSSSAGLLRSSSVGSILNDDPLVVTTLADVVDSTDGLLSLREALVEVGSIITFDPVLYADGPATIALTGSELAVDRDVSIEGPGADLLSIDAGNTSRVVSIGEGATVNLAGLTFTGGSTDYRGGGIHNRGTLTVTGCNLSDNAAGYAGGIYAGYGGGIHNDGGTLTVTNCTFSGNSAESRGGGIYSTGTLTMTDGTFSDNSAEYGGGIYNRGTLTVTDGAFSNNSAVYRGGGIYNTGTLTMTDGTLSGNSAEYGGGIHNDEGVLTVTNGTFSDNSAEDYGGGIYNTGTLTMMSSSLSDNSAGSGGGIYNSGTLTVTDGTFSGNSAEGYGDGGGVHNSGTLTVTHGAFSENAAERDGGGIYNTGTLTVTSSSLSDNSAVDGGGIYNSSDADMLTVTDSTFSRNSATSGGGVSNRGTARVINSALSGNSAKYGGGIHNYTGTLNATNCTLAGNSAEFSGGGIYNHTGTLNATNCTLAGNSAQYSGGGIYSYGTLGLNNSIVATNVASNYPDLDYSGDALTGSHNLIGNGTGQSALVHGQDGNLVGTAESPIDPLFIRNPSDGGDGWGDDPSTPDIDESANDDYGDLRLQTDSPAIDAGDNARLPADEFDLDADGDTTEPIPFDLAGRARVNGGSVDMGAYEYFAPSGIPGDLNNDGTVNSSDLDLVRANWGRAVPVGSLLDGDPSGDGTVNSDDLNIVRANWGAVLDAGAVDGVFERAGVEDAGGDACSVYGPVREGDIPAASRPAFSHRLFRTLAEAMWLAKRENEEHS